MKLIMSSLEKDFTNTPVGDLLRTYGIDFVAYNKYLLKGSVNRRKQEIKKLEKFIMEIAERTNEGLLLDMGCGTGVFSAMFSWFGYEVALLDCSKKRMVQTAKFVKRFGCNCYSIIADACHLPIRDSCLNVVFASEFVSHVRDLMTTLKEIRRTLVSNGSVVIADRDKNSLLARILVLLSRGRNYKPKVKYGQYSERMFSTSEMTYFLSCYGFSPILWFYSIYGSWIGRILNLKSLAFLTRIRSSLTKPFIQNIIGKYVVIGTKEACFD